MCDRRRRLASPLLVSNMVALWSNEMSNQPRWRHKKRGTTYTVIGNGEVQADEPLTDYEVVTIYRCEQTGDLWVRRISEFMDGRFELVTEPPAT